MSGPSLSPQKVGSWIWYYEGKRSIEVFIDSRLVQDIADLGTSIRFKIPRHMLKKSLSRMKP